jgi:hypothetical protein
MSEDVGGEVVDEWSRQFPWVLDQVEESVAWRACLRLRAAP